MCCLNVHSPQITPPSSSSAKNRRPNSVVFSLPEPRLIRRYCSHDQSMDFVLMILANAMRGCPQLSKASAYSKSQTEFVRACQERARANRVQGNGNCSNGWGRQVARSVTSSLFWPVQIFGSTYIWRLKGRRKAGRKRTGNRKKSDCWTDIRRTANTYRPASSKSLFLPDSPPSLEQTRIIVLMQ